jgi:uncharacterized damage-inducible protein DinB
MKYVLFALALAVTLAEKPTIAADAVAPASSGFKTDYLQLLDRAEKELTQLAEAMPDKKMTWRPAKGVRSVSEVYLHAAGAGYFMLSKAGREMPADVKALWDAKKWESQTTSRAAVKEIIGKSFAFVRQQLNATSDADFDKKVEFFGREVTQRALFMVVLDHFSEHLGQSIAYARMNGVTPPWSKGE